VFRMDPTTLVKQLKRLGINVDVEAIDADRVIIEEVGGGRIVIENPETTMIIRMPGGKSLLQVMGRPRRVEAEAEQAPAFTEEDVRLVAEQAGVSLEEARKALEETGGDIAEAIIRLQEAKQG